MKPPFLSLFACIALSCSFAVAGVEVRHDPSADFSAYRTYSWVDDGEPVRIPEIRAHLVRRIEEQLARAGLRKIDAGGDLDVMVSIIGATGMGTPGGYVKSIRWGVGVFTRDVADYAKGTLIVDIVDRAADREVWQGFAAATIVDVDYEKLRRKIDKVTRKMFREFPPKSSSK